MRKSSVDEIRLRFDRDVERFSNLQTGQSATMDAPLAMELVTQAAAKSTPHARRLLDVGCGAGNYSLKMLQRMPALEVTLIDLSGVMLDRACARLRQAECVAIRPIQGDIRELSLEVASFDIVLTAAALHHMRTDEEWRLVYDKIYKALAPGGSFWIFDLVQSDIDSVQEVLWHRYGDYLLQLKDEQYRDEVYSYIRVEDTPRSVPYQLELMKGVGFSKVDVLHKQACFAVFGGVKG